MECVCIFRRPAHSRKSYRFRFYIGHPIAYAGFQGEIFAPWAVPRRILTVSHIWISATEIRDFDMDVKYGDKGKVIDFMECEFQGRAKRGRYRMEARGTVLNGYVHFWRA
jgi:hypothetical protein